MGIIREFFKDLLQGGFVHHDDGGLAVAVEAAVKDFYEILKKSLKCRFFANSR